MSTPSTIKPAASGPFHAYGIRLFPAVGAGFAAGIVLLLLYYSTLALLPLATAYPKTLFPVDAWAHRLDLAQFIGSIAIPPYPTPLTWIVGLAIWIGTLAACGLVYAFLLSWFLLPSDALKGAGFGALLFVVWGLGLTLSQGNTPAVMRNALPDPGVLLLGWSPWAAVQLFSVYVVYGVLLGVLYRRRAAFVRPAGA